MKKFLRNHTGISGISLFLQKKQENAKRGTRIAKEPLREESEIRAHIND
jgi:hypothetical protein